MSQHSTIDTARPEQPEQAEVASQAQPQLARAEQLMAEWGHNVGLFIGTMRLRLQNAATSIRDEADRMDQPGQPSPSSKETIPASTVTAQETSAHQGETVQIVTQRAEQLVDGFAQRVSTIATVTGLQIRRTGAFIREDAEDVWAEAKSIRDQRRHRL